MKLADAFDTFRPSSPGGIKLGVNPHQKECAPAITRATNSRSGEISTTRKEEGSGTMKTLYCCMHERLLEPHDGSGQGRADGRGVERAHRS